MAKSDKKSTLAGKIVTGIAVAVLVICIGILVYTGISVRKNGYVKFFGYSFHIIQSGSMEPEIHVGELVVAKDCDASTLKVGDDVVFKNEDSSSQMYGQFICHRIVEIEDDGTIWTQGVNEKTNPIRDKVPSHPFAKKVGKSAFFGAILGFFTNNRTIVFVVLIAGVLVIAGIEVCSIIVEANKIKTEKQNQKAKESEEEKRKRIEAELRAELGLDSASSAASNDPSSETACVENGEKTDETDDDSVVSAESDEKTGDEKAQGEEDK